jgi:CBS domain-containing protein
MHARDIMSRPVVRVEPETPVREAVVLLLQHGFAALPVVNANEQVVGIFTESDALRGEVETGASSLDRTVGAVMSTPVTFVSMDTDLARIARHMLADRLRSIPVVADGVLVGIVGRRDLLRPMVRQDDAIAAELRALLRGYSGQHGRWQATVADGVATVRGEFVDEAERRVVTALARTVPGVTGIELSATVPSARSPAR